MVQNQKLLRLSSVLFMVQAVAWCLFAFLCILCIEKVVESNDVDDDYSKYLLFSIYTTFFTKDVDHSNTLMVVKPAVFEVFAFMHILLGICWIITSGIVFSRSSNRRAQSLKYSVVLKTWLVNGFMVALVDVIFSILLMVDMIETNKTYGVGINIMLIPPIGLVFTIASRGFTLWIVNVTFMVKLTLSMWTGPKVFNQEEFDSSFGNQFDEFTYNNNGYAPTTPQNQLVYPGAAAPPQQQYGNARMGPSVQQDYDPYRQLDTRQSATSTGYRPATHATPYAQINRNPASGRDHSPAVHAVPKLQIPEPDYQMGPRTVLKNRSQYEARY